MSFRARPTKTFFLEDDVSTYMDINKSTGIVSKTMNDVCFILNLDNVKFRSIP